MSRCQLEFCGSRQVASENESLVDRPPPRGIETSHARTNDPLVLGLFRNRPPSTHSQNFDIGRLRGSSLWAVRVHLSVTAVEKQGYSARRYFNGSGCVYRLCPPTGWKDRFCQLSLNYTVVRGYDCSRARHARSELWAGRGIGSALPRPVPDGSIYGKSRPNTFGTGITTTVFSRITRYPESPYKGKSGAYLAAGSASATGNCKGLGHSVLLSGIFQIPLQI